MITYTLEEAENKYLSADTHFEHFGIIRSCNRPFRTVEEMNSVLIRNWNETVQLGDTVYFLGDLGYGIHYREPFYWLWKLNGQIVFIRGNHDGKVPRCLTRSYEIISVDGLELLLIHNYQDAMKWWPGWIIHGHNHYKRPLVRFERKLLNVSVEVTDYKPISLARIVELIKNGEGK